MCHTSFPKQADNYVELMRTSMIQYVLEKKNTKLLFNLNLIYIVLNIVCLVLLNTNILLRVAVHCAQILNIVEVENNTVGNRRV